MGNATWPTRAHIAFRYPWIISVAPFKFGNGSQAIIWTHARMLLIGPLVTNFSEILIGILILLFTKMRLTYRLCNGGHLELASVWWLSSFYSHLIHYCRCIFIDGVQPYITESYLVFAIHLLGFCPTKKMSPRNCFGTAYIGADRELRLQAVWNRL